MSEPADGAGLSHSPSKATASTAPQRPLPCVPPQYSLPSSSFPCEAASAYMREARERNQAARAGNESSTLYIYTGGAGKVREQRPSWCGVVWCYHNTAPKSILYVSLLSCPTPQAGGVTDRSRSPSSSPAQAPRHPYARQRPIQAFPLTQPVATPTKQPLIVNVIPPSSQAHHRAYDPKAASPVNQPPRPEVSQVMGPTSTVTMSSHPD